MEVPFYVSTTATCMKFKDIVLFMSSTCESASTYQYGAKLEAGSMVVDTNTTYGMSNSSAKFSVNWMSSGMNSNVATIAASTSTDVRNIRSSDVALFGLLVFVILLLSCLGYIAWKQSKLLNIMHSKLESLSQPKQLHEFYQPPTDSHPLVDMNDSFLVSSPTYRRTKKQNSEKFQESDNNPIYSAPILEPVEFKNNEESSSRF